MYSNVRNTLFVFVLLTSILSQAEDWTGTYWGNVGKCFPSMDAFMKYTFGEDYKDDDEIKINQEAPIFNNEYPEGSYTAGDYTPARNASTYLVKVEKDKKACILAFFLAGGEGGENKYSEDGTYLGFMISISINRMPFYANEILYKDNKHGYYYPGECAMVGDNIRIPYNCFKYYGGRVFPSFDCSNLRKLNSSEIMICETWYLAELDTVLANNYKAFLAANLGKLREKLIRDQREWLKRRNACEKNDKCLVDVYKARIREVCDNYPTLSSPKPICERPEMSDFSEKMEDYESLYRDD